MKNERGNTLIQVLVLVAALSASMAAVTGLTTTSTKRLATSKTTTDFNNLMNMIGSLVSNDTSCTATLSINPPDNIGSFTIPVSDLISGPVDLSILGYNNTVLAASSTIFGSITVSSVRLSLVSTTPTNMPNGTKLYEGRLTVTATRPQTGVGTFGSTTLSDSKLTLNLGTDIGGTKVTSCNGMQDNDGNLLTLPPCQAGQIYISDGTKLSCTSSIPESGTAVMGGACTRDGASVHNASGLFVCHNNIWAKY